MTVRFVPSFVLICAISCPAVAAHAAVPYGPGALAIVVRDAKGTAVVGALVAATGPVTRQATTLTGGLVVLQALPLGTYAVSITKAGYATVETNTVVRAVTGNPQLLPLRLSPADLGSTSEAAAILDATLDPADDPFVSHALAAAPGVDILPSGRRDGSTAALGGTTPLESRAELDGIPLAADFSGAAALRFRTGLAFDAVDVEPGLASAPRDTALDTIGGVVDYRTAPIASGFRAGAEGGYDSTYGSFQRTRYSDTFGPFGVLTDLVTGGGQTRPQIFKARYAFTPATSLAVDSYGSQSSALVGSQNVTNVAPAAALDFKTAFGGTTFEARTYRSSSRTNVTPEYGASSTDDRLLGTQLNLDIPAGAALVSLGFDRRSQRAITAGQLLERTYSTVSGRATVPLGRAFALEVADAYGGGTELRRRHDPQASLTIGKGEPWSLRLSAGSAYATMPLDIVAVLPSSERETVPETSFGYRGLLSLRLDGNDRLWASAFSQRRYNALAALSLAKARGFEFGFERSENATGFGALAYVNLQRAYGYGALQPFARAFTLPAVAGAQLYGDAYSKARLAVRYRTQTGLAVRFGATLIGSNNAFTGRAFALGDASLAVPLGSLVEARIGIENAFGHPIADPILAGEFAPHEITFSIGRR